MKEYSQGLWQTLGLALPVRTSRPGPYSECNTQDNIAIERYTIQWSIFSVNVWTPALQTTSGYKDPKNNGTKLKR
jgi:hypothetical protein